MCGVAKNLEKPPLYWLDWRAERQQIMRLGSKQGELFSEVERDIMALFTDRLSGTLDEYNNRVARAIQAAIRSGRTELVVALEQARRDSLSGIADLRQSVAAIGREYSELIVQAGYQQGGESVEGTLGITGEPSPRVIAAAARAADRMADTVSRTQARLINNAIRTGVEEDLNGREVIDLLRAGGLDQDRAQAIARTETARAYVDGQVAAWQDSDVVNGKSWAISPFACQFCQAADIQFGTNPIPLDQPFYLAGDTIVGTEGKSMVVSYGDVQGPPLQPMCRCGIEASLDTPDDVEDLGIFSTSG